MLSQKVIMVCAEFGDEPIELPLEADNTLLLSTLNSAFPSATGIKFRNPVNNCLRAVKLENNRFHSPGISQNDGWESDKIQYLCVFPKTTETKVSADESSSASASAPSPTTEKLPQSNNDNGGAQPKTVDLIVLNLSSSTTEDGLKEYFESKFGALLMVELKRDRKTGNSRRFAFIRFKSYKDQMKALGQLRHKIDNQQVRLALPDFRDPSELYQENKCFIGRVNEQIKAGDLREFFSQFGDIVEISYPKKFKGYAFITFADPEIARRVCGQDFIVKGYSLCVSKSTHGAAKNKDQQQFSQNYLQNNNYQDFSQDWNSPWYQGPSNNRQDQWMSGQKYVTAPLNPSYGNSLHMQQGNVNPMINALSMAMQHANSILGGNYGNNQYNRNNNGTALWGQQQQQQSNNKNNNKKNNKKKSKNNAAKKSKEELAKRLEVKEGEENEEEGEAGDDENDGNDLSQGVENIDIKQEA